MGPAPVHPCDDGGASRGGKSGHGGGGPLYCRGMPCLEEELSRLHSACMDPRAPRGATPGPSVDRYLYLCGLLDFGPAAAEPGAGQVQVMRITCLCGAPEHTVVARKARGRGPCFPFGSILGGKPCRQQRACRGRGSSPLEPGASVPASCFVVDPMDSPRCEPPEAGGPVRAGPF